MNPAVSIPSTSSLPSSSIALIKTSVTKVKMNDIDPDNHHGLQMVWEGKDILYIV